VTHVPKIAKVLPTLASSQPDLYPGLILQKINGTAVAGKSLSECIYLTRGRVGTEVVLELYDLERGQTNTVDLTRKSFTRADSINLGFTK